MKNDGDFEQIEPLTEREREILELLVLGKTDQQIADALVISINTVKWYDRQIYSKLGVKNRAEAAEQARELGLVNDEPWRRPTYYLPHPATSLLGRERELEELESLLLDDQIRIVSIIGPGGMGKTRLAIELANKLNGRFTDGVAFIPLAPLQSEESIVPAIAQSLCYTFQGGGLDEKSQILNFLREKKLLIALDNYEHLIESAPLLTEITEAAPGLKMVVTSREKLRLQIEQLYPLQSLSLIDWKTLEQAEQDPAVKLFLEYGRRVRPNFELQAEDLSGLHQIMQLVGGMPLAIILASAWLELLTPEEIAAEIQENIDFLEAGYQDLPGRQRSMRVVFDASWKQLNEKEQKVFSALSVFRGGFTLDAAREVVGATPGILLGLVSRSLLNRDEDGRFDIHELLRQFGAEMLAANIDREEEINRQHSIFYANFLKQKEGELKKTRVEEAKTEIAADFENIRLAWNWAVVNMLALVFKAQTGLGLFILFQGLGSGREAASLFERARLAAQTGADSKSMVELLAWEIRFLKYQLEAHSKKVARELISEAEWFLAESESKGKDIRAEYAFFLTSKASIFRNQDESLNLLKQSLAIYSDLDRQWEMAFVHQEIGWFYSRRGNYSLAHKAFRQAVELFEKVENEYSALIGKLELYRISAYLGQAEKAKEDLLETLEQIKGNGNEWLIATTKWRLFHILFISGDFEDAIDTLFESRAMFTNWGYEGWVELHTIHLSRTMLLMGRYDEALHLTRSVVNSYQISDRMPKFHYGMARLVQGFRSLAVNDHEQARINLNNSLATFNNIKQPDEAANAQIGLVFVGLHDGEIFTAINFLKEVLGMIIESHNFMTALMVLPAASLLFVELGSYKRAIEIFALACSYGFLANSPWFFDVAGRKLDDFAATLPPENVEAAIERGRGLDLWETAESLLHELKASG